MKIRNAMIRLHLKPVGSDVVADARSGLEVTISNSQGEIVLKLPSYDNPKMPDFMQYVGHSISFSTKEGIIKGIIDKVIKWFGQDVYIYGEIASGYNWYIYGSCPIGYWSIVPYNSDNPFVETPFSPIQILLDEYLSLYNSANDLYYEILKRNQSSISALPFYEKPNELSIEGLEKFLREMIGKILWLRKSQPNIYKELISVLENKNNISETDEENK